MKRLVVLRHAKSGWDQPALRDFDRALNTRGKRAATVMGRHVRDLDLRFDLVLASPAVRVAETLDAFADGLGVHLAPAWDRRVYLASAPMLLELVQDTRDTVETLLLVGHNPGLEELILMLSGRGDEAEIAARDSVEDKYPTAAIAELVFDTDRWADVDDGEGRLIRFVRPRDLDPALGPDARD
jgi:phosphohistidine phosphatase